MQKDPMTQSKGKPYMDFRESRTGSLWAHVSNTPRLYNQMNQNPVAFKALLNRRHKFTDDQFFYMLGMIRDRQDQELGR